MALIRKMGEGLPGLFSPSDLVLLTPMLRAAVLSCINRRIGKELRRITAQYLMGLYRRHTEEGSSVTLPFGMYTKILLKEESELVLEAQDVDSSFVTARLGLLLSGEVARTNAYLSDIIRDFDLEGRVRAVDGKIEIRVQLGGGDEPKLDPRGITDMHRRRSYCCTREVKQLESEQGQVETERWFLNECARRMKK